MGGRRYRGSLYRCRRPRLPRHADRRCERILRACPGAARSSSDAADRAGQQFQLPGEDAIWVAEHLVHRYGLPKWQFTLSATQANTEVIRLARVATGRDLILVFDGKYHGHLQETMVVLEEGRVAPEMLGLPPWASGQARVNQFNDVSALEAALARRDVALVLTEPALTNAGIIRPESGFHNTLRDLTRATGTLLAIDETHTLVSAYGGLTGEWGLEPDFLTLGKSLAAGVPLATYGMTEALADLIAPPEVAWEVSGDAVLEVATGGTLFANALSMAAGKAALGEVLTEEAFDRITRLGGRPTASRRRSRRRASLGASSDSSLTPLTPSLPDPRGTLSSTGRPRFRSSGRLCASTWRIEGSGRQAGGEDQRSRSPTRTTRSIGTSASSASWSRRSRSGRRAPSDTRQSSCVFATSAARDRTPNFT
jgi:hypothetical protein